MVHDGVTNMGQLLVLTAITFTHYIERLILVSSLSHEENRKFTFKNRPLRIFVSPHLFKELIDRGLLDIASVVSENIYC
jgi:hypothetical protein